MLKPLGKRILIQEIKEERGNSLIYVPEKEGLVFKAKVLASAFPHLLVGDVVLVNRNDALPVPDGLLIDEKNVLGVIE